MSLTSKSHSCDNCNVTQTNSANSHVMITIGGILLRFTKVLPSVPTVPSCFPQRDWGQSNVSTSQPRHHDNAEIEHDDAVIQCRSTGQGNVRDPSAWNTELGPPRVESSSIPGPDSALLRDVFRVHFNWLRCLLRK